MLQAVIFDMDGLMIDSEPVQWRAMNSVVAPYGVTIDEPEWASMVGRRAVDNLALLSEKHHLEVDPAELVISKNAAYHDLIRHRENVIPMPGLYEAIDEARQAGLKLALGSSSVLGDIKIILKALSLSTTFDVVVSGDQVARGKPDPDIFLEVARRLAVHPSRCLVLEDTAHGVAAAKAAGMMCIAVPGHFTRHQDFSKADAVLKSLSELDFSRLN